MKNPHAKQPMRKKIKVNTNNTSPSDSFRGRMTQALSLGAQNHDIYQDFGYPEYLTFDHLYRIYDRLGIAANVVNEFPKICWSTNPIVMVGESPDSDFQRLAEKVGMFPRLKALDKRQRVGRYAGLFIRVKDDKSVDQPIAGKLSIESIVELVPLYENQLKAQEFDQDPASLRFNKPETYRMEGIGQGDNNLSIAVNIHHSRVIIAAEGADDGSIYGKSALEPIYNSLLDAQKIIGSASEGFYKNASQNVVFSLQDPKNAKDLAPLISGFNEQYDDFAHNRMRRGMMNPGLEAKVLDSTLSDPKSAFEIAIADIASGSGIHSAILIGEQSGRLASDENAKSHLHSGQARRLTFCNSLIKDVIAWFVDNGVLKAKDYVIEWDDLSARSDSEKLEAAERMAGVNEKQFRSAGGNVFDDEEIRLAAGYEAERLDLDEGANERSEQ